MPKRGKMIDTQKYIRDNLQAYADNKYFAFTKQPKDNIYRTIDNGPVRLTNLGGNELKRRNLLVGQAPLRTLENRSFISTSV